MSNTKAAVTLAAIVVMGVLLALSTPASDCRSSRPADCPSKLDALMNRLEN